MDPRLAAIEVRNELLRLRWPDSVSVARRNGIEADREASWAQDRRRAGELLGVWSAPARDFVYPDFQFDQYGELRRGDVRALLAALALCEDFEQAADRGGWRRAFWLYGKSPMLLDGAGEMQSPAERFCHQPRKCYCFGSRGSWPGDWRYMVVNSLPTVSMHGLDPLGFTQDGAPRRDRVLQWFGLSAEALAEAVQRTRGSGSPAMTTDHFIVQLAHLANAVTIGLERDTTKAAKWFRAPNPMLGGCSAMDMIQRGSIHRLQVFVENALQDSVEYPDRVNLADLKYAESVDSPGRWFHKSESTDSPGKGFHPSDSVDSLAGPGPAESVDSPSKRSHSSDSVESLRVTPDRAVKRTIEAIAGRIADYLTHRLTVSLGLPARLVCPSDEAEQAVIDAVAQVATARGILVEVIDLRAAPAERLDGITARLDGWKSRAANNDPEPTRTLLVLLGFDVFGDDANDGPTYPFRSKFQFDQKFLWLFVGQDTSRMRFLFDSHQRPLYRAAGDITPEDWRHENRHL